MPHSRGPWTFKAGDELDCTYEVNAIYGKNCKAIANVNENCSGTLPVSKEEAYANARLIAAAPDLLLALLRATVLLEEIGMTPIPAHECRQIINKATGS